MSGSKIVVFVHGWSVRSTDTYGRLPDRLKSEATAAGLQIDVKHVYLSKYVSFRDEVRMEDIAAGHGSCDRERTGHSVSSGSGLETGPHHAFHGRPRGSRMVVSLLRENQTSVSHEPPDHARPGQFRYCPGSTGKKHNQPTEELVSGSTAW